jgi:hypothetical protein
MYLRTYYSILIFSQINNNSNRTLYTINNPVTNVTPVQSVYRLKHQLTKL